MTKSINPYLTIRLPEDEKAILEQYCYDNRLTKTEVLRQFIRTLQSDQPIPIIMRDSSGWMRSMNPDQPTQEDIEWLNLEPTQNPHQPPYNWGDKKWEGNDRPTATHDKQEIREWLESIGVQADQEMTDAASLRSMAEQMLAIAERLEE